MADAGVVVTCRQPMVWQTLALVVCGCFLASVARFYHPGYGFTALVVIPAGHDYEIAALRELPHYEYSYGEAYDGAFYLQLAMDPLLKDHDIDRALDAPAYRARRILFSWTAWIAGMGRPAWILHVYSVQNVAAWLLIAWLLTRWLPPVSGRLFLLWAAAMFSQGLLSSVRFALLDGPSLLLLALAVLASERGRTSLSAAVVAVSGLGRETNLLGGAALPWPATRRGWFQLALACALILLPLLVWQDYLWSIYRGTSAAVGVDHITAPFAAYIRHWSLTAAALGTAGWFSLAGLTALTTVALTAQVLFLAVEARRWREPWWRLAAAYAVLMFVVHPAVWEGYPGAITRVVLPLTFGFNILLARWSGIGFWLWFVPGNLHVLAALHLMPVLNLGLPF